MKVADLHCIEGNPCHQPDQVFTNNSPFREDDATLSVRCVPKSVYLDSRKVFRISQNEKKEQSHHWIRTRVLATLLHRCQTQVVPRCSEGFIGNRIAKLILKKKHPKTNKSNQQSSWKNVHRKAGPLIRQANGPPPVRGSLNMEVREVTTRI